LPGRKRNYKAEYAHRISSGLEKGLTRAQARGHPGPSQALASQPSKAPGYNRQLEAGFQVFRAGKPLSVAAKEVHVAPERLRRYVLGQGVAERRGMRWQALPDKRQRRMLMYTNAETRTVTVDLSEAARVGAYMSAVHRFLQTNDIGYIEVFKGNSVMDFRGTKHPFETNPNILYRLAHTDDETFERVYRIIMP
jgi:hypothetical protein